MLKDQDRIFQNLYNDLGSDVASSQKRGDWINTKELTNKGRDTAVIFADGAAAAILSRTSDNMGILSTHLHTEGKYLKELWVEAPSSKANPKLNQEILSRIILMN